MTGVEEGGLCVIGGVRAVCGVSAPPPALSGVLDVGEWGDGVGGFCAGRTDVIGLLPHLAKVEVRKGEPNVIGGAEDRGGRGLL